MTTLYPIEFYNAHGRDVITHHGFAADQDEAITIASSPTGSHPSSGWHSHSAQLTEHQASHTVPPHDRKRLEISWAGWVVMVTSWEIVAMEREDDDSL